jgi:hypothetical protein
MCHRMFFPAIDFTCSVLATVLLSRDILRPLHTHTHTQTPSAFLNLFSVGSLGELCTIHRISHFQTPPDCRRPSENHTWFWRKYCRSQWTSFKHYILRKSIKLTRRYGDAVINTTAECPSWEADSHQTNKEFSRLFWCLSKSWRPRWTGHVARMGQTCIHCVGKSWRGRPLGRPTRRWENNIKMDLKEMWGNLDGWDKYGNLHITRSSGKN